MKKLILVLAILVIAFPAFAAVDVNLIQIAGVNDVNIVYTGGTGSQLPRAFALVITTDSNAAISNVSGYKVGESNSTSKGYGIYPAKVVIEANGAVTDWGTPLADQNDPGPSGMDQILPSQKLVLEFGSLYPAVDHNLAPNAAGNLAKLSIACNGSVGDVNIIMTPEVTYRGGIVLEDGNTATASKTLKLNCFNVPSSDCLILNQVFSTCTAPVVNLTVSAAMITRWNALGKPKCWCCNAQKCGNGVYTPSGTLNRVDATDLSKVKQSFGLFYTQATYLPCVDFNLSGRVDASDLAVLKAHFGDTVNASGCL